MRVEWRHVRVYTEGKKDRECLCECLTVISSVSVWINVSNLVMLETLWLGGVEGGLEHTEGSEGLYSQRG